MTSIFPTENDVADTTGDGNLPKEESFRRLIGGYGTQWGYHDDGSFQVDGGVIRGMIPSDNGGLGASVGAGRAIIAGHILDLTVGTPIETLTDNAVTVCWLQLTTTSGKVDGHQFLWQAASDMNDIAEPSRSNIAGQIPLAMYQTAGGDITEFHDLRVAQCGSVSGFYNGDGTSSRIITLGTIQEGIRPNMVYISADFGSGRKLCSFSNVIPADHDNTLSTGFCVVGTSTGRTTGFARPAESDALRPRGAPGLRGFVVGSTQEKIFTTEVTKYEYTGETFTINAHLSGGHSPNTQTYTASNAKVADSVIGVHVTGTDWDEDVLWRGEVVSNDNIEIYYHNGDSTLAKVFTSETVTITVQHVTEMDVSLNDNGIRYNFMAFCG